MKKGKNKKNYTFMNLDLKDTQAGTDSSKHIRKNEITSRQTMQVRAGVKTMDKFVF